MHERYIKANGYVYITEHGNHKINEKRKDRNNIKEILIQENRIEFLRNLLPQYPYIQNGKRKKGLFKDITKGIIFIIIGIVLSFYFLPIGIAFITASIITFSLCAVVNVLEKNLEKLVNKNKYISEILKQEIKRQGEELSNELSKSIPYNNQKDTKIIQIDEIVKLDNDEEYIKQISKKIEIASNYSDMEKRIKKEIKKKRFDQFLKEIGCNEEDQEMYLELYGIEKKNNQRDKVKVKK